MNGVGAMRNPGIEIQGYRAVYSTFRVRAAVSERAELPH